MGTSFNSARRGSIMLLAWLGLLATAILWFVLGKYHYASDISVDSYGDYYWPRRWGLLLHLAGGATAISTGLVQLWLGFSGRTAGLHRLLGRMYVGAIVVGAAGATYMAATIPGHIAYRVGLSGLNVAWIVTTGMAVLAISRRDIVQHRAWMIRSYTVTFAFVVYRLGYTVLAPHVSVPADPVASDLDTLMAWSCWVFPLLFAEVLIQLKAMRVRR